MLLNRHLLGLGGNAEAAENTTFRVEQRCGNAKDTGPEFARRYAISGFADRS